MSSVKSLLIACPPDMITNLLMENGPTRPLFSPGKDLNVQFFKLIILSKDKVTEKNTAINLLILQ